MSDRERDRNGKYAVMPPEEAGKDELGDKLVRLAETVLDDLLGDAGDKMTLDQRIDAIKAIGTLHLGLRRLRGKKDADDDGGGLPEMRARLKAVAVGE